MAGNLHLLWSVSFGPHFSFPQNPIATEQIMLRWLHFIFGIIWIGLLYFFNLVGFPTMKQLEASVRAKVYPVLMSRAMNWFRWSALVWRVAACVACGVRADLSVSATE